MLKNSPTGYGSVTKTVHWLMAGLIVFMLCLGLYMGGVQDMGDKLRLYTLHKSIGACILCLALFRVGWHVYSRRPPLLASLKAWEKISAHAVHYALYFCFLGMPLSGWLLSSAAGRSVSVFGLFMLPDLIAPDKALGSFFREVHYYVAWTLIGLISLHVAGALKHFIIDRDGTLQRMLPKIFAVVLALLLASASARAASMNWSMDPQSSTMTYNNGGGQEHITDFATDMVFDPQDLASSRITFHAGLTLAFVPQNVLDPNARALIGGRTNTGQTAPGAGAAVFISRSIARTGPAAFAMTGDIEVAGVSREVTIPFTVSVDKSGPMPVMVVKGSFTLSSADFSGSVMPDSGVGQVPFEFEFHELPAGG